MIYCTCVICVRTICLINVYADVLCRQKVIKIFIKSKINTYIQALINGKEFENNILISLIK